MYHLYTNTVLGGFVRLSVCPLYKPPSRCPISKLSTYSESLKRMKVPKSKDQLETKLKQHNHSSIGIFYQSNDLSELHSEEDIHRIADKTCNLIKKSYKTLVCDLASMQWRLQKYAAKQKLNMNHLQKRCQPNTLVL